MMEHELSQREAEQLNLQAQNIDREIDEIDSEVAKLIPEIRLQAGVCREYFDALKNEFTRPEEEGGGQIIDDKQLLEIVMATVGNIRK